MRHFAKMLYNVLKLYIRLTFVRLEHAYVKLQAVAIKSFSAEYFYQCRRLALARSSVYLTRLSNASI